MPSFVWPWIFVSGVVHAILVFVSFGLLGAGMLPGRGVEWGSGFGGTSVELEIAGPEDGPPVGSLPPSAIADEPAPAQPVGEPEPPVEEAAVDDGALAVALPTERRDQGREPERSDPRDGRGAAEAPVAPSAGQAEVDDVGASEATEAAAPGEVAESAGTGADDSTAGVQAGDPSGVILGAAGFGGDSVTARQALLPNSGVCTDPVVGTWRAQKYRGSDHTWVRFTLHIRRDGANLSGTITSRIWTGRPSTPVPGACTAFGMDHTWQMRARGRIDGDDMIFGSRHARLIRQDCPRSDAGYAPDRFSGTVHALREVFDATNNDGAFDIDEPYTFRRISCE